MVKQALARFLRQIPQSNQAPRPIQELSDGQDEQLLMGFAQGLALWGMVTITSDGSIQATAQTAKYALFSLADYLEQNQPIVPDWKTRGFLPDGTENPLQNGASLLYWLEATRLKNNPVPPPTRVQRVAQVVIKRTNPATKTAELLLQYDKNAQQYQLIGGRYSESDPDLLATMVREIEEEIEPKLAYNRDYALALLWENYTPTPTVSRTFGALTQYHFNFYHMVQLKVQPSLGAQDRWIPIEELLDGMILTQGARLPFSGADIFRDIDSHLPNGLAGLYDSFVSY